MECFSKVSVEDITNPRRLNQYGVSRMAIT